MPQQVRVVRSGPSGQRLYGGKVPPQLLTGSPTLGGLTAAGQLSPNVSTLNGGATFDSLTAAGGGGNAAPTLATLSGSDTATVNVPHQSRVTLDVAADQTYTVTWTRSNGGTGAATSTISVGQTTTGDVGSTWDATGTGRTVSFAISPALTKAGDPLTVAVADFAWTFADLGTVQFGRNSTTALATGVPAAHQVQVSPDLLPGLTPSVVGTEVRVVGDDTVPTTSGAAAGTPEAATRDLPRRIEVLPNGHIATIVNVTRGITYEYSAPGNWPQYDNQASNRWNAVWGQMNPGDIIEISPGAIHAVAGDAQHYYTGLKGAALHLSKSGTFRNMAGRGRWRVWPTTTTISESGTADAMILMSPAELGGVRLSMTIEGFDLTNQYGRFAGGLRVYNDSVASGTNNAGADAGDYLGMHASLTVRNFVIGKTSGRSYSGINGAAEVMLLEDGHVFDCGGGSLTRGQDHNLYIAARTMTLRGLRLERTRGWEGGVYGDFYLLEGHLAKLEAVSGVVEGCAFVCAPLGDQSQLLQMKAGGNWTVRGNLFVDSHAPNRASGAINMCREFSADGVTPNFKWYAGSEGNSLLFERNTWVGHYPRPIFGMFDWTGAHSALGSTTQALYPPGDGSVDPKRRMSAMTIRDNIAIVTNTQLYGNFMLAGFPGTNDSMWIMFDPTGGTHWTARGNTKRAYNLGAWAFTKRELLAYHDALGAPAASQGSQTIKRFVWPHGSEDVTRSTQGLG